MGVASIHVLGAPRQPVREDRSGGFWQGVATERALASASERQLSHLTRTHLDQLLAADDAKTGLNLIDAVHGKISTSTADAAYDTIAIYEAAHDRGAKVVVPPAKTATVSRRGRRSGARYGLVMRERRRLKR